MMREDWVEVELGKACDICDHLRKPINSKERAKRIEGKNPSDLYPYYGATGQVGFIDDYLTDGEYILIGEDGAPFFDHTKNIAYVINGKTWVNNHAHILLSKFNNKFLLHYLNQFNFNGFVSGTTRLKLTQGSLKKIPVKLAPFPEQRSIVAKIEKIFSDLDNGIANLKIAKAKLEIYRQAVLKKAFEGELTKEWRSGKDALSHARTADAESKNLPKDWKWTTLGKVAEVKRGKSKHRPRNDVKLFGGEYPFIQTGDVKAASGGKISNFTQTYNEAGLAQSQLWPAGTLCLTIAANIADAGFLGMDACFPDSVVGIKSEDNILSLTYLNYLIQRLKVEIDSKASATAQKNINVEFLNKLQIPLPPIQEQTQIVMEIESRLSVCDKLAETIDQSLEKAEALRQSILKKAFAGKLLSEAELAACRREPDWEPAQKLLERIQKEKSGQSEKTSKKQRRVGKKIQFSRNP